MVPWLLCALLGGWGLYLLGRLYCLHGPWRRLPAN